MRWATRGNPVPPGGTKRILSGFLFFPKRVNDEWRWLENASWSQEFTLFTDSVAWVNTAWGAE